MSATLLSVKRLSQFEVYDRHGDKLGAICDIMLDVDAARVRYAVLASKPGLTGSKKLFAVPLAALALDSENECFVIDVDHDVLLASAGFDVASPPVEADPMLAKPPPVASDIVSRPRRP